MRKLIFAAAILTTVWIATGCKDDKPTSSNADAKTGYSSMQGGQYTRGGGGPGATTTNP